MTNYGKIILKREDKNFHAGFCIIHEELETLVNSLSLLHPIEKSYYDSLKYERRKVSYMLGRIAAKKAISEFAEVKSFSSIHIDSGIFQFPVVKIPGITQNIQVSLSHCDNFGIALAFPEQHPLGIDIEKIDTTKTEAIKSQMSPKELELIPKVNLPLQTGCTALWTIKEGLSKIFRTGLTMDFKLLEVQSLEKKDSVYISSFTNCAQYKGISWSFENYVCTMILPKNTNIDFKNFSGCLTNIFSI
ncbi:MAG: 4'-phosphopantetheinyl transferase superfamily protein [Sporocytophaga sp.]|nr:4'-phosphopantetheinyl transferase superfamily protein [Sporocytophaga sp.]